MGRATSLDGRKVEEEPAKRDQGGREVTTCGAGPPPQIPGCPPPPAFPPPTATKASPHTQVSLLLNLDRGKVGGELHHHSGVPTGIQLSLVFARILGLIRKHLKVLTHASETCLIFWVYNTICRLCCMAVTSSTLMIN